MEKTVRRQVAACAAVVLMLSLAVAAWTQQAPAAKQGETAVPPKVVVAGENPAIRKLDKEGGRAVTNANFFRVHWSPVGSGTVCYLTVSDPAAGDLRIAIHDNPAVLDYVTNQLMASLMPNFNVPPYVPHRGTIAQSGDGIKERRETCRSEKYTVELIWKDLGEPRWADLKMGANTLMTFVMVPAGSGEILINGKSAPGTWYPTGGGIGTGAYLALNETWRR